MAPPNRRGRVDCATNSIFTPMCQLFDPLTIRGLTLANRIAVSSMCQYSSESGFAGEWHFVHLGSHAVGGAGLVMTEAAAVLPEGRISPEDLGIYGDDHIGPLLRITRFIRSQGSVPGMQLAHAGRKASTWAPAKGRGAISPENGGWTNVVAPSAIPFADDYLHPEAVTKNGIQMVVKAFAKAAHRALEAGFQVIEIHAAHGYLLHEFLSPLSNKREDEYGGTFANRIRIVLEVVNAIRKICPEDMPLFVRISATDWTENGWDITDSIELARHLKGAGVDLIDCSSGGNVADAKIPVGPGYQVTFAEQIRREAGVLTGAVGMITAPAQADQIIRSGQADLVLLARQMLRDPYWPLTAARELGQPMTWPLQYLRAAPSGSVARAPVHKPSSQDRPVP